jgi:hypothetical protein
MKSPEKSYLEYEDFEIEIASADGPDYTVSVLRSPAGEAHETFRFPFDELILENRLKDLQIALLRSGGERRHVRLQEEASVNELGRKLFDALLIGQVGRCYDVSCSKTEQNDKGLRIKLRIQSPKLAALPWEYLYDSRRGEYVCLSRYTPIVRYPVLAHPIPSLRITPPLRILGMIVSSSDLPPLDVEREQQRLETSLGALKRAGLVELTWLEGKSWRDLQREMRNRSWHIFHFIGHGGYDQFAREGLVVLADEQGRGQPLPATELARLLADNRTLRLVVLNSCDGARGSGQDVFTSTAAILVRRGIPAVVAMQYEITDRAAIEFSRTFCNQ